jgi:hypothetical protein
MNYFTLLLLLFAALTLVQTYRLRAATESTKQYKRGMEHAERMRQLQIQATDYWRQYYWADYGYYDNLKAQHLLLEQYPKLHAKKLRRILSSHYKRQYKRDPDKGNVRDLAIGSQKQAANARGWVGYLRSGHHPKPSITRKECIVSHGKHMERAIARRVHCTSLP